MRSALEHLLARIPRVALANIVLLITLGMCLYGVIWGRHTGHLASDCGRRGAAATALALFLMFLGDDQGKRAFKNVTQDVLKMDDSIDALEQAIKGGAAKPTTEASIDAL